ncbi:ABC transporter substrate-binding protein [Conexibacter arvalis]|uniref:Polar amino acid transport system substrate-binding protein n=1 Tax=Conexibacter arvalis TaxID=912552 RepID=A0A840ILI9_9ACTN|nr:ABC transporter substrate-binding protein [Conexibacter arvalis]MBB4664808.1 polar amino acid transport system substrate-binding protein [Conexibacter arvalis]
MRPTRRHAVALLAAAALPLTIAACGSDDESDTTASTTAGGAATTAAQACEKGNLTLVNDGQLTVATDRPAYPPYFEDDDPTNGRGFESAVAYAIAKQLGFSEDEVRWVVEPFNSSYAPGPKRFDFDVNQISITPQRERAVDFSSPYYTAPQAVVALREGDAARVASLEDLKDVQIGVQIGTTSLDAVTENIEPSKQPKVFNDSNDVVRALKQGQVDAVVVDLPSAFYLTAAQVPEATIVGQFEAPGGDSWGALLQRGSSLTECVSNAVDELRDNGTLARLEQQWMGEAAGAPELR